MQAGTKLGPYEIERPLGEGGMGQVYLAEDSRLGRRVAVKVLPPTLAGDAERLARLEREARLLAQLEHRNVAAIYGFEELTTEAGGPSLHCLVMQYVAGRTLEERVAEGALPIDEALEIARQVAAGVGAAHDRGIIHRDLKPGNVMLVEGTGGETEVKVLDFGLAKEAVGSGEGSQDLTSSPTMEAATAAGLVLGTAAYMSPEQARGKALDRRTDVWAFGCVLYEMLSGRKAFSGPTVSDTLASILKEEPDWSLLPAPTPRRVRVALERCLAKDAGSRPYDVRDVALDLRDQSTAAAVERESDEVGTRARASWLVAGLVAGGIAGALLSRIWLPGDPRSAAPGPTEFQQLTSLAGAEMFPAVSPDGEWILFASRVDGDWDVYLQGVGGDNPINLTAASEADDWMPAFSPDGRTIAFRSERDDGGIFVMGRTGESVRRVSDRGYNPSWSPDGRRLAVATEPISETPYARSTDSSLYLVDVESGEARMLETGDAVQPAWSKDGDRLVYWGLREDSGQRDLWTIPVDGGRPVSLTEDEATDWTPVFGPDGKSVLFSSDRDGTLGLWQVELDPDTGAAREAPRRVLPGGDHWIAYPSIAADQGRLVYSVMRNTTDAYRVDLGPDYRRVVGGPILLTPGSRRALSPDLSPDGEWLAFNSGDGQQEDIFLVRLDGTASRRLTHDPAKDRAPRFAPDGRYLSFYSDRDGGYRAWTSRVDGSDLRSLPHAGEPMAPSWSPDGQWLAANRLGGGGFMLYPWRESGEVGEPVEVDVQSPEGLVFFAVDWSPEGRRLVGTLQTASGHYVGVQIHDLESGETSRVTDSGEMAAWLPDSRHIAFFADSAELAVVDSETGERWNVLSLAPGHYHEFISTRGRSVIYSLHTHEDDVWMAYWNPEDQDP